MNLYSEAHPDFRKLVDLSAPLEVLGDSFQFTEGPVWHAHENRLYFSDIPDDSLYRYSDEHGVQLVHKPSGFSNGLTLDAQGNLIACEHRTRAITRYVAGEKHILASTYHGKRLNSPNDLVMTRSGTIYFSDPIYGLRAGNGGPAEAELDFQGVYAYREDWDEPRLVCADLERPNGVALTRDESTLLVVDTVKQHIRSFAIQADHSLRGGQVIAELWGEGEGRPDGLKLDSEDNIFCTGPSGIWVLRTDLRYLGRINLPQKTANLAWGGEGGRSLYITSSRFLYRLRVKTSGQSPLAK